jgi:predicted alpha-1,2-mannosidase
LAQQANYAALVNPFIGTGGHGHTYPGASRPYGMMQLSPDTRLEGWDGCGGYHYSDSLIYGFSHTHLSGTGVPDYCDLLLMPFTGAVKWKNKEYASPFSHKNEKAHAGYYAVKLDKHNIMAELTTSVRSGMHQYTFAPGTTEGRVLIDLQHRDEVLESSLEVVNEYELRGVRRSKSWTTNQHFYFYIRFEKPMAGFGLAQNDAERQGSKTASGKNVKGWFGFSLGGQTALRVKVGISGVSMANAKLNLDAEIPAWDFAGLLRQSEQAWNTELGKIAVKGGTANDRTIFYTALYHATLSPNVYTDVNGEYRGTDLQVHKADGFTNYTVFSLWDTHRALHPLLSIIDRGRTLDFVKTFLKQYQQGGMLPVWELSGNETFCMIGYHAVPVIVDAWQKGIRDFDQALALEAMTSYANSNRFGLPHYRRLGYLPNDLESESVSKTVEYAYDDWCIAQFAKWTGRTDVADTFMRRALSYRNLYDATTGHLRGRVQGLWYSPFKPGEVNNFYTEGNSWHYSFSAQQDISGLMGLHGGDTAFLKKLELLFTTKEAMTGRDQADVTGLIGQYAHGNEPSHHIAYLFNYAGKPWRTQELVHRICKAFYTNAPDGLIGNEDCGQMSAWYVLSAMGFYPVTPGSGVYAMGTPLLDEVTISLENGRTFTIKANGRTDKNFYVQAATLNGKTYPATWLSHDDIAKGGALVLKMGSTPNIQRGMTKKDRPVSVIPDVPFVQVPALKTATNKFKTTHIVAFVPSAAGTAVYYRVRGGADSAATFTAYTMPFTVSNTCQVDFYAERAGLRSGTVTQQFYKVPSDKTIQVTSKVNPMYSGGGSGMLIDGITATANWRSGEWQSYYGTDLEATIDLLQVRPVRYVGVHVLQDVSPWIVYPKQVVFEISSDGKNYTPLATVANPTGMDIRGPVVQTLGSPVQATGRYLRVKAVNGGKLPAWHESAGQDTHLFIDEVVVR